jgi:NitT/TauT family transport system substrate-binding protein
LTLVAASCGDDSDDDGDSTGTGSAPEEEEAALPASCDAEEADAADGEGEEAEDSEDDAAGGGGGASGDLTPITVGILPIADLAPLYYGVDEGYFEDEGLDVTLEPGQGGAALVPAVTTGEYQFAFGNYISLMLARQNDVGVQIVANIVDGADTADRGTNALLVDPEKIGSLEDLVGKRVAVTTLENVAEVNIGATLIRNGVGDDESVEYVEMGFPDMNAAVESGEVDAAWTAEPFVTIGEAMGLESLADPMYETTPSMPLAGMFASEDWLAENADVANAFYRALARSMEASSDEEAMRDAIVANTQTEADQVGGLALANWDAAIGTEKLSCTAELAVMFDILEEEPNLDELIWQPEE